MSTNPNNNSTTSVGSIKDLSKKQKVGLSLGITLILIYAAALIFLDVENYKYNQPIDLALTRILSFRRHSSRRQGNCTHQQNASLCTTQTLEADATPIGQEQSETTTQNLTGWR